MPCLSECQLATLLLQPLVVDFVLLLAGDRCFGSQVCVTSSLYFYGLGHGVHQTRLTFYVLIDSSSNKTNFRLDFRFRSSDLESSGK